MEKDVRSKLIEVGVKLFATKGFAGVSVRELTVAAQINVSAISYYFNGKDGLYQAILEEQFAPIQAAIQLAEGNDSLSPLERLTLYAKQIAHVHMQGPFIARLMNSEVTNPTEIGGPIIEKRLTKVYQFISRALQEGVERGDFREDLNVTYAAISLAGIINFYFIGRPMIQKVISLPENANIEYAIHAFNTYLYGIMSPIERH